MEPTSPVDKNAHVILVSQIRECFGRVVYSHKTHEKCADILLHRQSYLKNTQIILSVLVSGSLMADLAKNAFIHPTIPAVLATVLLGINLYFKNYNFGQIAQNHKETADKLWNIRESYISLIADLTGDSISAVDAMNRRDKLQNQTSAIYAAAPRTNSTAYKKAQIALQFKEDMTFSVAEIDAFLPSPLKLSTDNSKSKSM